LGFFSRNTLTTSAHFVSFVSGYSSSVSSSASAGGSGGSGSSIPFHSSLSSVAVPI
jgi:hypothetical protein